MAYDAFENLHKFQDDVWGQIRLNDVERDVIDTPEYQRLFRTSQLGFVELVYHTANHTRGAHSIGACRITNRLIDRLVDNSNELYNKFHDHLGCEELYADFEISLAERALIRLGALLHDVSHVPLSHDLEKKSHKIIYPSQEKPLKLRSWYGHYEKHDDWEDNPLLFRLLCDRESSVLARVLRHYSAAFWDLLKGDARQPKHHHLEKFVELVGGSHNADWKPETDLLPQLVFHLLFYEKQGEAEEAPRNILTDFDNASPEGWHLGPKSLNAEDVWKWHDAWYQPFRHDIIGNTLSADLIDYLTRDPQHLGTPRRVDLHLLSYYALVRIVNPVTRSTEKNYRCAIDLHDHKRGTTRTFLLNDLFRLLDLRQDIHEKAVVHRVVQSANAMLARGLLLLGKDGMPGEDKRPKLKEIVGLGTNNRGERQQHALQSEDMLFHQLLEICSGKTQRRFVEARRIFEKLTERRVCRPLVVIPGDWAYEKLSLVKPQDTDPDFPLRTLAAIIDSACYSPFLLFVCSCVEKYLEWIFDTDTELCSYANKIGSGEAPSDIVER